MKYASDPKCTLLYVDSPAASAAFYEELLGRAPVESSPTFAMFVLASGLRLGLWSKHTVEPAAPHTGGGGELGFVAGSAEEVEERCKDWRAKGLKILQEPVRMDFGHTFVALDPDNHRLRVFYPME